MTRAQVTERLRAFRQTKLYDLIASAPLVAWFAFCSAQMFLLLAQQTKLIKIFLQTDPSVLPVSLILSALAHLATLAFFVLLIVMFMIRHVPQRTAPGFYPRFTAVAGTFLSLGMLLLPLQELSFTLYLISLFLVVGGIGFSICALLVLGRSMSIVPQARRLVTSGPYALVRHPLYIGEIVAMVGVALQFFSVWALLLFVLQTAFQLLRMKNEERLLVEAFPEYRNYMASTASLVPGVF